MPALALKSVLNPQSLLALKQTKPPNAGIVLTPVICLAAKSETANTGFTVRHWGLLNTSLLELKKTMPTLRWLEFPPHTSHLRTRAGISVGRHPTGMTHTTGVLDSGCTLYHLKIHTSIHTYSKYLTIIWAVLPKCQICEENLIIWATRTLWTICLPESKVAVSPFNIMCHPPPNQPRELGLRQLQAKVYTIARTNLAHGTLQPNIAFKTWLSRGGCPAPPPWNLNFPLYV